MSVLVDSSVWIAFFRGDPLPASQLDTLLAEDRVSVNELILCELIPILNLRKQHKLVRLLRAIPCLPLTPDWPGIEAMQSACLRLGYNGIGIPDLLIAQNAIEGRLPLFSLDKHFAAIASCTPLQRMPLPPA